MFFDIEKGLIVLEGSIGPWLRYTLYWAPFYCNLYLTRQPHSYTTTDIKTNIEEEGVVGSVWARGPTPDLSQRVAQGHRPENQPNVHLKTNNVKLLSTLKHLQSDIHFSKLFPIALKASNETNLQEDSGSFVTDTRQGEQHTSLFLLQCIL